MANIPTIIPEELHLLKAEVVKSNINAEAFYTKENHSLNIAHQMMHNLNDERVKLELAFSFGDDTKTEIAHFKIDFHFKIDKMKEFYSFSEDNKPVFFGPLVATLLGIAISTARGIIFERCSSNGIPNLLIPIVSPQKMLQSPRN